MVDPINTQRVAIKMIGWSGANAAPGGAAELIDNPAYVPTQDMERFVSEVREALESGGQVVAVVPMATPGEAGLMVVVPK